MRRVFDDAPTAPGGPFSRCVGGLDAPYLACSDFSVTTVREPVVQTGEAPSVGREPDPEHARPDRPDGRGFPWHFPVTTVREPVVQTGEAPSLGRQSDPRHATASVPAIAKRARQDRGNRNEQGGKEGQEEWTKHPSI